MIMEVETRIMRPQAKECLQPPAAKIGKGKKKKKGKERQILPCGL